MPRDSNGQYTLPAGNPVVTDTDITSNWGNTTMGDIGNEITNSLDRTGRGGMTGPFGVIDGTAAQPGLRFIAETNSGLYRPSIGVLGLSSQGSVAALFNANGIQVPAGVPTAPSVRMEGGATGFYSPLAGTIGFAFSGVNGGSIDQNFLRLGADVGGVARSIIVNGPLGLRIGFYTQDAGVNRWFLGSNATDDYAQTAYDNIGAAIDDPIAIIRAAGGAINIGGQSATKRTTNIYGPVTYKNQVAAAATPAANDVVMYTLNGVLYAKDSAGNVFKLAPSGTPVGMIIWRHSVPTGYLQTNGQTVSKATYATLWTYAQGFLTTDQVVNPGLYLDVDASNFKVPNLVGLFLRSTGGNAAALGVLQTDSLQDHTHNTATGGAYDGTNGGSAQHGTTSAPSSGVLAPARSNATETRSVNVSLISCVYAG
jgi:hypothetical protein